MKSVIVILSVLSLLVVVSEAWFLNLKSGKSDTATIVTSAPNSRKMILVAKKVYVPMYASDDSTSAVADRLLPISPALTPSDGIVSDGRQQPMAVDYSSSMYLQPPPVASYAMYAPASANVAAAYAAPVQVPVVVADQGVAPQQYAVYPAGYGAAGPQFVQYAGAPQMSDGTWVMQYAGAGQAVAAGAPYYRPTGNDKEMVADGSAVPVPTEAYANV
ncbi:uncharacterized protein LOC124327454 isoform X3 [Daphnia pulicaria]|uniref:uncharacterized protein LOC124327454 isoform X1 n=1 Tax=Daphnia pulicaria TaxID=35523 RepID=UPI001EEA7EF8|nr:uncharacterized protein LOC124327454 isoform X1 [Daphnia pulicaria]XP_046642340.1 uncharacterized protein LOC124327454 isoform X2 [Daphnia pulicaria]XP_046642341.1 uncharacterized protein LOC124327454 isoform X3 [Daphnia pulicaria]